MKKIYLLTIITVLFLFMAGPVFAEENLDTIDEYLQLKGMSQENISVLTDSEKQTIYDTIIASGEAENIVFNSYEEKEVPIRNVTTQGIATRSISEEYLKFSVSSFTVSNNLCRTYIFPHYEWITFMPDIGNDCFSYAISFDAWDILTTPSLETKSRLGVIKNYTRPDSMDFDGASFNLCATDVEGTGTIIARRVSNIMSGAVLVNYVHDPNNLGYSIGFGPISIGVSPSGRDGAAEILSI